MPLSALGWARRSTAMAVGLCAATALGSLPAGAAPVSPARPAPLSAADLARMSPQALARRQQPLLHVAQQVLALSRQGAEPGYAGYAGVSISVPDDSVTVSWKGPLPRRLRDHLAAAGRSVRVTTRSAPYTWRELENQTRTLVSRRATLRAEGITVSQAGPAPDGSGITVGVDYAASALAGGSSTAMAAVAAQQAVAAVASGPAPVSVRNVPTARPSGTRQADNVPWWGGDRIVRPGNVDCSAGFSIRIGSTAYMLTAGHCGGINTAWQTGDWYGSGTPVGTEANRDPNGDTAIIAVSSNEGWIYDKGWDSSVGEAVIGSETTVPGTYVCTEGATSGVRCSIEVQQTGLYVSFGSFAAYNEVYAASTSGSQSSAGGDSGGPVIVNSGTSGQVYGVGTISGGSTSVACSNIDPNVTPACTSDTYFEDLPSALGYWGAWLP